MPKPLPHGPTLTFDSNAVRLTGYGKICRPLSVLAVSSSALSFDGDDADTPFETLANRPGQFE